MEEIQGSEAYGCMKDGTYVSSGSYFPTFTRAKLRVSVTSPERTTWPFATNCGLASL